MSDSASKEHPPYSLEGVSEKNRVPDLRDLHPVERKDATIRHPSLRFSPAPVPSLIHKAIEEERTQSSFERLRADTIALLEERGVRVPCANGNRLLRALAMIPYLMGFSLLEGKSPGVAVDTVELRATRIVEDTSVTLYLKGDAGVPKKAFIIDIGIEGAPENLEMRSNGANYIMLKQPDQHGRTVRDAIPDDLPRYEQLKSQLESWI